VTTWDLTIHSRAFTRPAYARSTGVGGVPDARSRRLEMTLNAPARFTFTVDGRSPSAALVQELTTDLMAWRDGVLMFHGVIDASEDVVTEQAHSVNFTAHDYLAVVNRRFMTAPLAYVLTATDQDDIAAELLDQATTEIGSGLSSYPGGRVFFAPGSNVPLQIQLAAANGQARARSGVLRDRTYAGQTSYGQAITDLGACQGGFDVDVGPAMDSAGVDYLRVWYPQQGVNRTDVVLAYGATVSGFTRSVNAADYANYRRLLGGQVETAPGGVLFAEAWNTDANDVTRIPVGLWQAGDQESDVTLQPTLDQHVAGALERSGELVPSYSLTLRPGWYVPGHPAMGDTLALVLKTGRLDVDSTVRVLGVTYAIGDDGSEDVEMTVGRPALSLSALFREVRRDVSALARR
jgi:hypothetical protein